MSAKAMQRKSMAPWNFINRYALTILAVLLLLVIPLSLESFRLG